MSVFVDDMECPFGRMKMCHMYADSHEELVAMADTIGVARKWIQYPGHPVKEHFDIALSKKKLALENGAIGTTWREYGEWAGCKRRAASVPQLSQTQTAPNGADVSPLTPSLGEEPAVGIEPTTARL